jgi:integrase
MLGVPENRGSESDSKDYLSGDELDRLLSHVRQRADLARLRGASRQVVDELIVLLLTGAGLRAGELCNLSIGDLCTVEGRHVLRVRSVDAQRARYVDIPPELVASVQRFIKVYRKGAQSSEPLIASERGTRLTYMSLYSKVKRVGKEVGIARLHPRMLRRTYLVRLYEAERDLRLVQQQAGHATYKTTALYVTTDAHARKARSRAHLGRRAASPPNQSAPYPTAPGQEAREPSGVATPSSSTDSQAETMCEACGAAIAAGIGTMIDSGQILCPTCLRELRRKYGQL